MKLENQVVSLDLAKRLKELGVKQESYFYWLCNEDKYGQYEIGVIEPKNVEMWGGYSAFTVAELGAMLPEGIKCKKKSDWYIWLANENQSIQHGDTEADARAKMLVYLLENKLINNPPAPVKGSINSSPKPNDYLP